MSLINKIMSMIKSMLMRFLPSSKQRAILPHSEENASRSTSHDSDSLGPPTKEQLLKTIDNLKKNPNDRVRILGDGGITILGASLGGMGSGTVAAALGGKAAIGLFGWTLAAATPIGWIIGGVVVGSAAAYGISRLIRGGAISEGRKKELLQQFTEQLKDIKAKESADKITDTDKTNFTVSLRELIEKDILLPEDAAKMIAQVEQGLIPLSDALLLVQNLFQEQHLSNPSGAQHGASIDQQLVELRNRIQSNEIINGQHEKALLRHEQAMLITAEQLSSHNGSIQHIDASIQNILELIRVANTQAKKTRRLTLFAILISLFAVVLGVVILVKLEPSIISILGNLIGSAN